MTDLEERMVGLTRTGEDGRTNLERAGDGRTDGLT
jgi:hypothetical protein